MEATITWHPPIPKHTVQPEVAWPIDKVLLLFELPFNDLLYLAQQVHRENSDANEIQLSTLLSIKTGGCPEDCSYCPQSSHHDTGVGSAPVMPLSDVVVAARHAREQGATRFCIGAAWRSPKQRQIAQVAEMVREVRALGLETCVTLGMLAPGQAEQLREAGLDYYNHNLDTSPEFYGEIISTRTYDDRLMTLQRVRGAGIKVCCGGIVGLGESRRDRAGLIAQLAGLDPPPESVPINNLVRVEGTPLANQQAIDPFEFVRTIAVVRITMSHSTVRLSAGREQMDDALQALCFLAGANSIFYGDRLLVTSNPQVGRDRELLARLGIRCTGDGEISYRPSAQGDNSCSTSS